MNPKLIEPGSGPEQTREIPISKGEFLIGRGPDCDLRLGVSAISRHHCMIRIQGGEATLLDLGSSNGTYVNGQRVRSSTVLHTGDEIRLDTYRFLVNLGDGPAVDPAEANAATHKIKRSPPPKS